MLPAMSANQAGAAAAAAANKKLAHKEAELELLGKRKTDAFERLQRDRLRNDQRALNVQQRQQAAQDR